MTMCVIRVLKRMLDLRGRKLQEAGENCMMRKFIIRTIRKIEYANKIKEDEIGGACSRHGEMRNAYQILVGKPE
jgi:hypothetical protein